MFNDRLWMDSFCEPQRTPCARRWGEERHARQAHLGPQAYQARLVRHCRGTRRVCQVRLRTWRHTSEPCRPPPSLSKTNAQSRRGGHHGVWWACTHQAICQHPRRPFQKPLDRDHGVAARNPDLAAKCILHCFFYRDGGRAHSRQHAGTPAVPVKNQYKVFAGLTCMTQDLAQSVLCIVF